MVPGQPDPARARTRRPHRLQVLRRDREHGGHPLNGYVAGARQRLDALHHVSLPSDLRTWAQQLASASGDFALLGAGVRADTYPALLWNGARLHRAGAAQVDGLTLVALASASDQTSGNGLERGVLAGLRVAASLAGAEGLEGVGRPTCDLLPAATCAAVVGGADPADLTTVLDLAGTLMVVGPPSVPRGGAGKELDTEPGADAENDTVAEARAGHCLAAGWLAARLLGAGLVAHVGALDSTLAAVTGRAPGELMARLR